jgi:hypothetical protein
MIIPRRNSAQLGIYDIRYTASLIMTDFLRQERRVWCRALLYEKYHVSNS